MRAVTWVRAARGGASSTFVQPRHPGVHCQEGWAAAHPKRVKWSRTSASVVSLFSLPTKMRGPACASAGPAPRDSKVAGQLPTAVLEKEDHADRRQRPAHKDKTETETEAKHGHGRPPLNTASRTLQSHKTAELWVKRSSGEQRHVQAVHPVSGGRSSAGGTLCHGTMQARLSRAGDLSPETLPAALPAG